MKRLFGFLALGSILATGMAACGGGDDDDDVELPNPGFVPPEAGALPEAYNEVGGVWELQGDADFGCLNTASDDVASTEVITLSGTTRDFQTDDIVDNVNLAMFHAGDPLDSTPIATTTSDVDGLYSIDIPAGSTRLALRSTDPEDPARFFDSYLVNQYFNDDDDVPNVTEDLSSVSFLTGAALPAFVGVMRTEGLGIVAAAFRDCQDREVAGIIATMSAVSCAGDPGCEPEHLEGGQTFYFSAGSTSLPVRLSQAAATKADGLFVIIELPPSAQAFLQVWGYATQGDADAQALSLLGEIPSPVLGESVITGSIEPYRTGQ